MAKSVFTPAMEQKRQKTTTKLRDGVCNVRVLSFLHTETERLEGLVSSEEFD